MKNDPTDLAIYSKPFTQDSQTLSSFEAHALAAPDSTGLTFFELGLKDNTSSAGKFPQAVRAWNSFESYA